MFGGVSAYIHVEIKWGWYTCVHFYSDWDLEIITRRTCLFINLTKRTHIHISVLVRAHSFSHESTEFYTVHVAPGDTNAAEWMSNLNSWTSNKNTSPCKHVEIFLKLALCWIYCIHMNTFYTTDANYFNVFVAVKSNSEWRQSDNYPPPPPRPDTIAQMSCRAVIAKVSQMKGQCCSWRTCWEGDGPWLYENHWSYKTYSYSFV